MGHLQVWRESWKVQWENGRLIGLGKNATGYLGQYPRDPITERQVSNHLRNARYLGSMLPFSV